MATETWLVTALPYSASPGDAFHVSLFVTHRLTPDGAQGVVSDFATVQDWTSQLRRATFTLRGGGPGAPFDIPCTALLDRLDDSLWSRVFPASFPVRPWKVPNYTAAPWQTFAAHRMQAYGLLTHGLALASSPVNKPGVDNNLFVNLVLQGLGLHPRELPLSRIIDGAHDREITKRLDELSNGGRLPGSLQTGHNPVLMMMSDLHAARRFYQRTEDTSEYHERPVPGTVPAPVKKPTPDFHERAGMLGDLSPLLRKLGLIIDLRVNDVSQLASASWIQGDVGFRAVRQRRNQPRTSCQVVGETFTALSSSGDYDLGMLKVGDETRYTVLDLDPDATALKLEQYTRQLPRIVASGNNGDPTTSSPSSLRATGFALARLTRGQQLHNRLDGAAAKDAALVAGTAPPLTQEEISRGLRLEVWDDVSREWHSLHQRLLTVEIDGAGQVLTRVPDAGFLQGAALTSSDSAANSPKYAHEVVAGWDGWSLSAPRPGKVVVHDNGNEAVMDAPPPDPAPVNPVASTSEVAPGTLPRLRYGRRYAMRAYAVDLAGNSRPHAIGGVTPGEDGPPERRRAVPALRPDVLRPAARPEVLRLAARRSRTGGIVLSAEDAATSAATRLASKAADALLLPSRAPREEGFTTADLKSRLAAMRSSTPAGPVPGRGVPGVNPAGFSGTRVAEVDRLIGARLAERAAATGATPLSRAQQVEQAFHEAASSAALILERTDVRTEPGVAGLTLSTTLTQQHGLAPRELDEAVVAQIVGRIADVITTVRPFLRWDALIEPAVVPRYPYTEGESLLRMVIRSGVSQAAPGDLTITMTPPTEYAATVLADHPELGLQWREDSQRHVAPPKTSQLEAELHGAFEAAMGTAAPGTAVKTALGISLLEAGSFLDTTVADVGNPGQRLPQPGVSFHVSPTAEVPAVDNPEDLPDGASLTPGQYVAHDVDQVKLPYLPDPIARGVSLMFPDAGKGHHLAGLFALEGTTLQFLGEWPELVPFRFVLQGGPELGAEVDGHVVRITLPPGEQIRVRLASSVKRELLDLFGLWASLPAPIRDNPFLREVAADGWFWWLTPSTEMRFVHAVPRPIEVPRPTILVPVRAPGDTAVALFGAVDLHGPSTDRIDIEAKWSQWVDDIAKPAPEQVSGSAIACGTAVNPDEDLVVLSAADATIPLPDGATLRLHAAVHQTNDTLHRNIDYRVRATTRYREYFHPQVTPSPDDLSLVGPMRTLNVPSSARPAKVIVRDVLPLFRWHEETESNHPFGMRRTRKAGLRLYLDRPWYSTGDGELLGIILSSNNDPAIADIVSQWAADPVFRQQGPAARNVLPLSDLLHLTGLDDRVEPGRPVAPAVLRPLVDRPGQPNVWVLGYQPEYSLDRGMWFVDIAFDPATAFWPFVQLAVARYQPDSLTGLHLGPVTMCDYAQLAPERTSTLSRTDETHVRVVVTGPVGHPRDALTFGTVPPPSDFFSQVVRSRRMRVRLERLDATVGTDLGWVTIGQWDLPILGAAGPVFSWAGELPLPEAVAPRTPGTSPQYRVTVEEWELLPADFELGGTGGWQPRVVYADHLPL